VARPTSARVVQPSMSAVRRASQQAQGPALQLAPAAPPGPLFRRGLRTSPAGLSKKRETCHAGRGDASDFTAFQAESEIPRSLRSPGMTVLRQPRTWRSRRRASSCSGVVSGPRRRAGRETGPGLARRAVPLCQESEGTIPKCPLSQKRLSTLGCRDRGSRDPFLRSACPGGGLRVAVTG